MRMQSVPRRPRLLRHTSIGAAQVMKDVVRGQYDAGTVWQPVRAIAGAPTSIPDSNTETFRLRN